MPSPSASNESGPCDSHRVFAHLQAEKQFDLDFLMTSEREWGCYPSLPALSICHLSTRPGFNAIAVTRWTWNGRELRRV